MYQKSYEELGFTDDFMFCKVLGNNEELCRELLELILGKKIRKVVCVSNQKPIEITSDGKGVRLDVYMEDDENTVYDIEMQTTDDRELAKRSRYYLGMIDLNLIERGARYRELKKAYVIFLCTFDPFGKGRHIYTFQNACRELPELCLEDDSAKVFVNAYGTADDVSEEMDAFLKYLTGKTADSELVRKLEAEVENARHREKWRLEYMTLLMRDQEKIDEGIAIGIKQGIEQGIEQGESRLVELISRLDQDGRSHEIMQAVSDKEIRKKLFREYGID